MRNRNSEPLRPTPVVPAIRTEETLRRMWTESGKLTREAADWHADADQCSTSAAEHERAAAAEASAARADRTAEESKRAIARAREAEAADLVDIVNEKRLVAGLAALTAGDPYPEDPAAGLPQAGAGDTRMDPVLPPGVVPVDAGEAGQA